MDTTAQSAAELELKGVGVSPGIISGPAFVLAPEDESVVVRDITPADVPHELRRYEQAQVATRQQIRDLQHRMTESLGKESAEIFEAHLLMLEDRAIYDEIVRMLQRELKNIEYVLHEVTDRYAQALHDLKDEYLSERAVDVRDIARRLLHNLAGRSSTALAELATPCIIIAHDLSPTETAGLNKSKVLAFATDLGSPTSHTAIMARALGIPAVVGMHYVILRVAAGDPVLVDGQHGLVFVHPAAERIERYDRKRNAQAAIRLRLGELRDQTAMTRDGYHLPLAANIELPADAESAMSMAPTASASSAPNFSS